MNRFGTTAWTIPWSAGCVEVGRVDRPSGSRSVNGPSIPHFWRLTRPGTLVGSLMGDRLLAGTSAPRVDGSGSVGRRARHIPGGLHSTKTTRSVELALCRCDAVDMRVTRRGRDDPEYRVRCFLCGHTGPWKRTVGMAARAWNRKGKQ
jgi:hypothetical protein